jgi:hypothetical protein
VGEVEVAGGVVCSAGAANASSLVLLTAHPQGAPRGNKGRREKENKLSENNESDVHLPQPQKQLLLTSFVFFWKKKYRVFGRFVTRGFQKQEKTFF